MSRKPNHKQRGIALLTAIVLVAIAIMYGMVIWIGNS